MALCSPKYFKKVSFKAWLTVRRLNWKVICRPKRKAKVEAGGVNLSAEVPQDIKESSQSVQEPPLQKKRKPTPKQLEIAEAAARPRYRENMRPPRLEGQAMRIVTWNVTSLNSLISKDSDALRHLAEAEAADVICLQETKLQTAATEKAEGLLKLDGWHAFWACSQKKKGYSGTAALCRKKPLSVTLGIGSDSEHDDEGRVITLEFESIFLVNVYTPNSGEGLKRLEYRVRKWDPAFAAHVGRLQVQKPVVITGDLNCAHQPIDIHSPWTSSKLAGFTPEERESFTTKYATELQLLDCFREQHPGVVGYTYWSMRSGARAKNKGWRLDYFLASKALEAQLHDCYILKSFKEDAKLSDHCPIGLVLKL